MELELLTDEQINEVEANWLETAWDSDDEFHRMVAKAQAEITAKQILNRLRGINRESGDNLDFDRHMARFRDELTEQLYGVDSLPPTRE